VITSLFTFSNKKNDEQGREEETLLPTTSNKNEKDKIEARFLLSFHCKLLLLLLFKNN